jgi:hypothetical protein
VTTAASTPADTPEEPANALPEPRAAQLARPSVRARTEWMGGDHHPVGTMIRIREQPILDRWPETEPELPSAAKGRR